MLIALTLTGFSGTAQTLFKASKTESDRNNENIKKTKRLNVFSSIVMFCSKIPLKLLCYLTGGCRAL